MLLTRILRAACVALIAYQSAAGAAQTASAAASTWSASRPIRLVVPFPAGGPVDHMARMISNELGIELGQPIIIENRAGAGGALAAAQVAKADADGHTISLVLDAHTILPSILPDVRYDPAGDFTALGLVAHAPMVIAVNAGRPYQSFKDVVVASRAKPKVASYGVSQATMGSLAMLHLQKMGKFELLYVPYKGAHPALSDALAGQIDMVVGLPSNLLSYFEARKMRPLAVTTAKRWARLPEVPTLAEQGFEGIDWTGWMGLIGPPKMPEPVVRRIEAAVKKVLVMPSVRERIEASGMSIGDGDAAKFGRQLASESVFWRKAVTENKLKID